MGSIPYALSIHNFISSVGADAGFASIIGLAILVLLYFAHARETSALRDQAADLAARLEDAEARLVEAARSGIPVAGGPQPPPAQPNVASGAAVVAAPATVAGAVRIVGAPRPAVGVAAAAPFAPAGLAAPALATATRFVPVASPAEQPAPQPAPAPPPPLTTVSPQTAAAQSSSVAPSAPVSEPVAAEPVSVQPATAPVAAPAATLPAPQTVAGAANGGGQPRGPVLSPARPAPPRPLEPPSAGRRPYPPLSAPPRRGSRPGRWAAVLIGVLVVIGVIVGLIIATSGSGPQTKSSSSHTSNAPLGLRRHKSAFNPATVTVAVLNGTATNQLAHRIALHLTARGYQEGRVATAADQTRATTIVAYLPGFRSDALHVANALGLSTTAVQPIDQSSQQVACPGSATCPANVVVTVGADLATS